MESLPPGEPDRSRPGRAPWVLAAVLAAICLGQGCYIYARKSGGSEGQALPDPGKEPVQATPQGRAR